jgi:hypothetical protein
MPDERSDDMMKRAARCDAILREIKLPREGGYGAEYFSCQARAVLAEELASHDPRTWEDLHRLVNARLLESRGVSDGSLDLIAAIGPTRRGPLPT